MSLARPIIYTQRHLRAVPARTVPESRKELKLNLFITRIRSQPSILLLLQVAVFQLQQLLLLLLPLPPQDAPLCCSERGNKRIEESDTGKGTLCSLLYKFKWISIINFTNFCHSTSAQREVAVAGVAGVAVALVVVVVAALVVVVAHVAACKSVC